MIELVENEKDTIIVAKGCQACEELKKNLGADIEKYNIMDATTDPKAMELVKALKIKEVPTILRKYTDGKLCTIDPDSEQPVRCIERKGD